MTRDSKGWAIGSLFLCALLWSSGGILIKLVSWDPLAIAGARSLVAFFAMLAFIRMPRFTFSVDQVMAAVSYSATMILFVLANKMTTSANAVLLQYTEPIYIIILGRFFLRDEKPTLIDILVIAGVFFGMILFFLDDLSFSANAGNLIAVLSGIAFAFSAIFMRRQKNGRPADSFMLAHVITFAVSVPFMLHAGVPSVTSISGLFLLGVFQMGIPSMLFGKGIAGVTVISTVLITMLEPILNPVWVALFMHEYPTPRAIAGGVIILLCVTLRTVFKLKKI